MKAENRRLKEENQRRLDAIGAEKEAEIEEMERKVNVLNEQVARDRVRIEALTSSNETLSQENKSLLSKF